MEDFILAAIRRRLKSKVIDMGPFSPVTLRPGNAVDVDRDEEQLGFTLPPLMKRIYTEIGNGGFGPGYGLIGLTNGVPDDLGQTGPDIYRLFRDTKTHEPNWVWPSGLLPICHWGCSILSCADCADPDFRMRIFDPNFHEGDDWTDAFFEEASSFESWIAAWATGVNLWELMYGEKGLIAQIVSARRGFS